MRLNVGVIFGGKSVEHEISILSAVEAMSHVDPDCYQVIPIYIDKENVWYTGMHLKEILHYRDIALVKRYATKVNLIRRGKTVYLQSQKFPHRNMGTIDIVLPIGHGTYLEDGSLQGYLEMLGIPYAGSKVGSSFLGQDKAFFKELMAYHHIPVTNFVSFTKEEYEEAKNQIWTKIEELHYPLYVKPAHLGSSIGIEKVTELASVKKAVKKVFELDSKILIEEEVPNTKEVSISVLGNKEKQEVSAIEEINCHGEFYSFKEKYVENYSKGIQKEKQAKPIISKEMKEDLYNLAKKVFVYLEASGVARIDFLIDEKKNKIYVNEINTIPGDLAAYLWQEKKKSPKELIDDLIAIAVNDFKKKQNLTLAFDGNLLEGYDRKKGSKLKK